MIKEFLKLYKYRKKHNTDIARRYLYDFKLFTKRFSEMGKSGSKVLEIGAGKNHPFSILFSQEGFEVTALDTQYVGDSPLKYWGVLRYDGLKVFLKTLFRDIFFTGKERKILVPGTIKKGKIKFVRSEAESLPFDDDSFDIVFSYGVFEHIENIEAVLDECSRVVKPDGIIYILIHLFTSLSGGHDPSWFFPETDPPENSQPWDHLRKGTEIYKQSLDYSLNGYRLKRYREDFNRRLFVIGEYVDKEEGISFLTENLANELKEYSREELLTTFVTFAAGKKEKI